MTDPMTTDEVARELGLAPVTVRAQFNRGRFTGRRASARVILIDRASVEYYRRTFLGRPGRKKGDPS